MKNQTAKKIIDRMLSDKIVKLRGNKYKGISTPTWCAIANNLLLKYDVKKCGYNNTKDGIATYVEINNIEMIVSNKIELY